MESKTFKIGVEEKKGKTQVIIVESKGGVSSWVRLGPMSVEVFLDSLNQCHQGREKWKMGKGMERKWENLFLGAG